MKKSITEASEDIQELYRQLTPGTQQIIDAFLHLDTKEDREAFYSCFLETIGYKAD